MMKRRSMLGALFFGLTGVHAVASGKGKKVAARKLIYMSSPRTEPIAYEGFRFGELMDAGYAPYSPRVTASVASAVLRPDAVWQEVNFAVLAKSAAVVRYPGHSKEADAEMNEAFRLGVPVYFSLDELADNLPVSSMG